MEKGEKVCNKRRLPADSSGGGGEGWGLYQIFGVITTSYLLGKNVQLKVEHLMDLVHLVLESVVFVSPCPIIQILS